MRGHNCVTKLWKSWAFIVFLYGALPLKSPTEPTECPHVPDMSSTTTPSKYHQFPQHLDQSELKLLRRVIRTLAFFMQLSHCGVHGPNRRHPDKYWSMRIFTFGKIEVLLLSLAFSPISPESLFMKIATWQPLPSGTMRDDLHLGPFSHPKCLNWKHLL